MDNATRLAALIAVGLDEATAQVVLAQQDAKTAANAALTLAPAGVGVPTGAPTTLTALLAQLVSQGEKAEHTVVKVNGTPGEVIAVQHMDRFIIPTKVVVQEVGKDAKGVARYQIRTEMSICGIGEVLKGGRSAGELGTELFPARELSKYYAGVTMYSVRPFFDGQSLSGAFYTTTRVISRKTAGPILEKDDLIEEVIATRLASYKKMVDVLTQNGALTAAELLSGAKSSILEEEEVSVGDDSTTSTVGAISTTKAVKAAKAEAAN